MPAPPPPDPPPPRTPDTRADVTPAAPVPRGPSEPPIPVVRTGSRFRRLRPPDRGGLGEISLGVHPDVRPYHAMRLIRGENLQKTNDRFHRGAPADPGARRVAFRALVALARFDPDCRFGNRPSNPCLTCG